MNIQELEIKDLRFAEYNPRTITKEEFEGLRASLKTYGQVENIIVNQDMTIISGHQRSRAWESLGNKTIMAYVLDLDKHEEKKLNVLMNSQAISGTYDDIKLSEILEELKLDDDYAVLRLDVLEPLDLSLKDPKAFYKINLEFSNEEDKENAWAEVTDIVNKYNAVAKKT